MQAISRLLNKNIQESVALRDEKAKYSVIVKFLTCIIKGLQSETSSADIARLFEHLLNAKGSSLPEVQTIVKQLSWIVPKGIYLRDDEQVRFVDIIVPPNHDGLIRSTEYKASGPENNRSRELDVLSALEPESFRETHCELYRELTLLEDFWRSVFAFPRLSREQYPSLAENEIVLDMFIDSLRHYIPFSDDSRLKIVVVSWLNAELFDILDELRSLYDTHENTMIGTSFSKSTHRSGIEVLALTFLLQSVHAQLYRLFSRPWDDNSLPRSAARFKSISRNLASFAPCLISTFANRQTSSAPLSQETCFKCPSLRPMTMRPAVDAHG